MTASSNPTSIAIIAEDEDLGRLLLAESAKSAGLAPLVFDRREAFGRSARSPALWGPDFAIGLTPEDAIPLSDSAAH